MKLAKRLLIALAVLISIPFLVALALPTTFSVEREITIDQPVDRVFRFISHLKNQSQYSKWAMLDPGMKQEFRGTDGTKGFVSAWQSDHPEVGTGEQEIVGLVPDERLDIEIRFQKPFVSTDPAYTITESVTDTQTRVRSGYRGKMAYPTNLMISFVQQKIGEDIAGNLSSLKAVLERK